MSCGDFAIEMRLHELVDNVAACEASLRGLQGEGGSRPNYKDPMADEEEEGGAAGDAGGGDGICSSLDDLIRRVQNLSRSMHKLNKQKEGDGTTDEKLSGGRGGGIVFTNQNQLMEASRRPTQLFEEGDGQRAGGIVVGERDVEIPSLISTIAPSMQEPLDDALLALSGNEGFTDGTGGGGGGGGMDDAKLSPNKSTTFGRSDDSQVFNSPRHLSAYSRGSTACSSLAESSYFVPVSSAQDLSSKATMTALAMHASTMQQTEEEVRFTGVPDNLRNLNDDCQLYISALERRWTPQEIKQLKNTTMV